MNSVTADRTGKCEEERERGGRGMGKTGEKEKRRSQGNVDPQAHSNNLFNLLVSCQGTSSSLEYVPVLIKRMCHTEVEEK